MSELDELEKELIDDVLAELPELRGQLSAAVGALLLDPTSGCETAEEVIETLGRRAGFIDYEPLAQLLDGVRQTVRAVADGRLSTAVATGLMRDAGGRLSQCVERLQAYDLSPFDLSELTEGIAAAITGNADEPASTEALFSEPVLGPAGSEEELTPEAMVALLGGPGDGDLAEDEPLAGEADDEDEELLAEALVAVVDADPVPEADVQSKPAEEPIDEASTSEAAATSDSGVDDAGEAAVLPELERVDVEEGPVSADIADFLPDFLTESGEIIEALDEQLVQLEDAGADLDLLNEIFRSAHTLKGTAGFLGFAQMADLTHKMENVLDLLRREELTLTSEIMDVILRGVDRIKALLADIRAGQIARHDLDDVRLDLVTIAATGAPAAAVPTAVAASIEATPSEDLPAPSEDVSAPEEGDPPAAPAAAPSAAAPKAPAREAEQIIRVDVERIDKIMNLAEELVLGRNRLLQLNASLEAERGEDDTVLRLGEATGHVGMLTGELQEAVMTMRMIPASRVFSRFPRMVRDLARDLDKQIDLVIEDNDTEIDKSVADEIGDPLVHLIRNSVDHGVETPAQRREAGKPERGRVVLAASHEGNHIVIRIQDDGKGMDPAVLKAKAVEKGVLTAADAARMPDDEAYNLIFAPGFSTAQTVTGVSGRGVGMDVVKTNISRLSGTIQLDSELGVGTEVTIRLPLTLAIIGGLQVAAGSEVYILPLTSVIEAVKIDPQEIEQVRGGKAVVSRGKMLPLIDLGAALQVERSGGAKADYVVIAGLAERRVGVLVDRLLGQVDVVIKALGDTVGPATGIAGATILGDGNVALILDVGQLMDLADDAEPEPVARRA